jgi:hypothetical protein
MYGMQFYVLYACVYIHIALCVQSSILSSYETDMLYEHSNFCRHFSACGTHLGRKQQETGVNCIMRSFIIYTLSETLFGHQIRVNEMCTANSACGKDKKLKILAGKI